ncbi:MAG: hypothetical protein B7Z26_07850 [Asticcacaulis sp. 32-58-5]|nr:MAG: hypothetical protein B7Z26_07850 [Asticcacaulis sp. 32-58-5]
MTLAPYESRLFVFGEAAKAQKPTPKAQPQRRPLDGGWTIAFGDQPAKPLTTFGSWADDPAKAHYSGVTTYSRTIKLSPADLKAGLTRLSFGEGTAEPIPSGRRTGSQAWLSAPVRDAAEVFVNGKRAGAVWTSPFSIDLKPYLKAGDNRIDIRVANTAINVLSGQPPTDYSALNAKYGERFTPQNMNNLQPLPSGLMQAPVLETAP